MTPPLFHPNFGAFPLGSARAKILTKSPVNSSSKYSNLCDQRTWMSQTDRRLSVV